MSELSRFYVEYPCIEGGSTQLEMELESDIPIYELVPQVLELFVNAEEVPTPALQPTGEAGPAGWAGVAPHVQSSESEPRIKVADWSQVLDSLGLPPSSLSRAATPTPRRGPLSSGRPAPR